MLEIEAELAARAREVETALESVCAEFDASVEPRLAEAMRYSLLAGGKRIRPVLLWAAGEAVGGAREDLVDAGCAIEMIHAYSLVHDDLPSMDDDAVRRGKPSTHVAFGEAIAILAGDALLTDAFERIGRPSPGVSAERRLEASTMLARAAGAHGMVGGQVGDVLAEGHEATIDVVESIHRRKTGALLTASVRIGALLGGADEGQLAAVGRFGENLGYAFQVADDLLDAIGDTAKTGKSETAGSRDEARGKSTVPARLGIDGARAELRRLDAECADALAPLGEAAAGLRRIAGFVAARAL